MFCVLSIGFIGKYFYADGSRYEGEFKDGSRHVGKYFDVSGNRYEGEYLNDKMSGQGNI